MRLTPYHVLSPEFDVFPSGELDPAERGRSYRRVFARTKRRAVVLAVASWRRRMLPSFGREWPAFDDENPYKGVRAYSEQEWAAPVPED